MDHFADRYRVVTIDLAGHGESGLGRTAWTMPAFGADVVAVADHMGLREMVLIGHSMGGDVIVEAALRLPGRVIGLVWVDVYRTVGENDPEGWVEEFLAPFRADFAAPTRGFVRSLLPGADPDLVEWVAADMSAAPPEVAIDCIRHAVGNESAAFAAVAEIGAPVVAINPDHRPTDVEALSRHGVRTVIMPGVTHFPMLEAPEAFNRLLGETIERFQALPAAG